MTKIKVDAHQHYWKLSRGDYGWLKPESKVLYQDYMPERLRPWLDKNSVSKTVVVQAAPTQAETQFLLDLCEQDDTIAGVVGQLDLYDESGEFEKQLLHWSENKYFVGIRPSFKNMEAGFIPPRVIQSLELMMENEVALDLLIRPNQMPFVLRLLEQLPDLKAVINHLGNPDYLGSTAESWETHTREIAQYPNVYCKLSGMVNHVKHRKWTPDDFRSYVHHVVDCFGSSRVMFGSDWPVCLMSANYTETIQLLEEILPSSLSQDELDQIFGLNAISFYGLNLACNPLELIQDKQAR